MAERDMQVSSIVFSILSKYGCFFSIEVALKLKKKTKICSFAVFTTPLQNIRISDSGSKLENITCPSFYRSQGIHPLLIFMISRRCSFHLWLTEEYKAICYTKIFEFEENNINSVRVILTTCTLQRDMFKISFCWKVKLFSIFSIHEKLSVRYI